MIKPHKKLGIAGDFLNLKEGKNQTDIYQKDTANTILNGERVMSFLLRWHKNVHFTLTTSIQSEGSSQGSQSGKENKSHYIGKKIVKLLADDKIMYLENPKESIKKTITANKFNKVA